MATGSFPYRARDGTKKSTRAAALVAELRKKGQRLVWSVNGQVYEADGNEIFATQVAEGVTTRWPLLFAGQVERAEEVLEAGEKFFFISPDDEVKEVISRATMFAWLEKKSGA